MTDSHMCSPEPRSNLVEYVSLPDLLQHCIKAHTKGDSLAPSERLLPSPMIETFENFYQMI